MMQIETRWNQELEGSGRRTIAALAVGLVEGHHKVGERCWLHREEL